jgi:hypothetical protein
MIIILSSFRSIGGSSSAPIRSELSSRFSQRRRDVHASSLSGLGQQRYWRVVQRRLAPAVRRFDRPDACNQGLEIVPSQLCARAVRACPLNRFCLCMLCMSVQRWPAINEAIQIGRRLRNRCTAKPGRQKLLEVAIESRCDAVVTRKYASSVDGFSAVDGHSCSGRRARAQSHCRGGHGLPGKAR